MIKLNLDKFSNKKIEEPIKIFSKFDSKLKKALKGLEKINSSKKILTDWLDSCKKIDTEMVKAVIKISSDLKKFNIQDVVIIGPKKILAGPKAMVKTLSKSETNNINFHYISDLSNNLINNLNEGKINLSNFAIIVMDESNSSIEVDINLRNFYQILVDKVGVERANKQVIVIAKSNNKNLWKLVDKYQWTNFSLKIDVKAKYSALTPLFLLPMQLASINIKEFIVGIMESNTDTRNKSALQNSCYQYAVIKSYFHSSQGSQLELMTVYDESLSPITKLFETINNDFSAKKKLMSSSGSNCIALCLEYSDSEIFKTQQKLFFETAFTLKRKEQVDSSISDPFLDLDEKGFDKELKLSEILKSIEEVTIGENTKLNYLPSINIEIDEVSPKAIGYMYAWFIKSNIMNLILSGINPFETIENVSNYDSVILNLKKNSEALKNNSKLNSFQNELKDEDVSNDELHNDEHEQEHLETENVSDFYIDNEQKNDE